MGFLDSSVARCARKQSSAVSGYERRHHHWCRKVCVYIATEYHRALEEPSSKRKGGFTEKYYRCRPIPYRFVTRTRLINHGQFPALLHHNALRFVHVAARGNHEIATTENPTQGFRLQPPDGANAARLRGTAFSTIASHRLRGRAHDRSRRFSRRALKPWATVTAGKVKVPLGLERIVSASDLRFIERAFPHESCA